MMAPAFLPRSGGRPRSPTSAPEIRQCQARRARLGAALGTLSLAGANCYPNGASTAHGASLPLWESGASPPPASAGDPRRVAPKVGEDRDEDIAENIFRVPEDASWTRLKVEAQRPAIGQNGERAAA